MRLSVAAPRSSAPTGVSTRVGAGEAASGNMGRGGTNAASFSRASRVGLRPPPGLRLKNGNTLITESDFGRAFEITREGDVVWEYYNPHRGGENDEFIATLMEVLRLPADFPLDWL